MSNKNGKSDKTEKGAEVAPLPHIFDISGREVVFKERYPYAENRDLLKAFSDARTDDADTYIPLMSKMIVSWEFDGDPADPNSYKALETVSELYPLMMATLRYWNHRFSITPKNSQSASTPQ